MTVTDTFFPHYGLPCLLDAPFSSVHWVSKPTMIDVAGNPTPPIRKAVGQRPPILGGYDRIHTQNHGNSFTYRRPNAGV